MTDPSVLDNAKQSLSSLVRLKVFAHRQASRQHARRHLWDEAFKKLSVDDAALLSNISQSEHFKVDSLIATVNDKIDEADRERWQYTKSNGEVVLLRTVLQKILNWVKRFEAAVDVAVSYNLSGYTAAPWAIIKLLLNTGLNSSMTRGQVVEGVEYTAKIVTLFSEVEIETLRGTSRLKTQLTAKMLDLYLSVLTFFAKAREYLMTGSTKRFFKGIVHSSDSVIGVFLEEVQDTQREVLKVKSMVDAEEHRALLPGCKTTLDMHIADNKLSQTLSDATRGSKLRQWLNAVITSDTLANARMNRSTDTCNWILEQDAFKKWKRDPSSHRPEARLLCIHAEPGFGKTVLCARLIDYMQTETSTLIAYFFVVSDDKLRRDPNAILRSWIYQLAVADTDALNKVYELYKSKSKNGPDTSDIWEIFGDMIKKKRYCFIIDGYDEFSTENKDSKYQTVDFRAQFLRKLIFQCAGVDVLLLIVSRDQEDIRSALETAKATPEILFNEYSITTADTKADVQALSRTITSEALANKGDALQEEIASEAAERADGLFLWVSLLGKKLREERGRNAKQLRAAVRDMPDGLESAYEQEFNRLLELRGAQKEHAMAVLRWVLFATRPMTVKELAEALTLNSEAALERYPFNELPDEWATSFVDEEYVNSNIRLSCGSLVELRLPEPDAPLALQTIHFVHFSVKEFLLRSAPASDSQTRIDAVCFPDAAKEHEQLATLCLQYLCYDIFGAKTKRLGKVNKRLHDYPFLRYAAISWPYHALSNRVMSQNVRKKAEKLFNTKTQNWRVWSEVFESLKQSEDGPESWDEGSDLDSNEESRDTTEGNDAECDASDSDWDDSTNPTAETHVMDNDVPQPGTEPEEPNVAGPIYYAAWLGLTDMVKILQAEGLNYDACGGSYGTPLQAAVANGCEDVVEYLISQDVDISRECGRHGSAMAAAVFTGSVKMMQMLLAAGADLHAVDLDGRTLLHVACYNGDATMVDALLKHEAVRNSLSKASAYGELPLHEAVMAQSSTTVKMLLQYRFDINIISEDEDTPLTLALTYGQEDVVRMLVHAHADITFRTKKNISVLHMAAGKGMLKFVKYLIEHKADILARNVSGWTALHYAVTAPKASKQVMMMLLDHGALVDAVTDYSTTPLLCAATNDTVEAASLLIERGADINAQNADRMTPLSCAISWGAENVVRLLLEHHADVTSLDSNGESALDVALEDEKRT